MKKYPKDSVLNYFWCLSARKKIFWQNSVCGGHVFMANPTRNVRIGVSYIILLVSGPAQNIKIIKALNGRILCTVILTYLARFSACDVRSENVTNPTTIIACRSFLCKHYQFLIRFVTLLSVNGHFNSLINENNSIAMKKFN